MQRFYLLPKEEGIIANQFGPKYLKWKFNTENPRIDTKWAAMPYGNLPTWLIFCHDISQTDHNFLTSQSDVYAFPENIDGPVNDSAIDSFFEPLHIPTDWLTPATTWRGLLRNMAGIFLFDQRYKGIAAEQTGKLHSLFDNMTLDNRYNDLTPQEKLWFDATIVWFEQAFGLNIPKILPNMKFRIITKMAGDFWENRPLYMGGFEF